MIRYTYQTVLVLAFLVVLATSASPDTISRSIDYPFNSMYTVSPDSTDPGWTQIDFYQEWWGAVQNVDIEEFPIVSPPFDCPKAYFRGTLDFSSFRVIVPSAITAVYVWMSALTEFDLWFNGSYLGGEHTPQFGPPMAFDVTSLFNPSGKNVVAVRTEFPGGSKPGIVGTVTIEYSMPTSAVIGSPEPRKLSRLEGNSPNPFARSTQIKYRLVTTQLVEITIYNALGQVVRTLPQGVVPAGDHWVSWEGKDNYGQQVAPGSYFYELRVGDTAEAKKAIVVR